MTDESETAQANSPAEGEDQPAPARLPETRENDDLAAPGQASEPAQSREEAGVVKAEVFEADVPEAGDVTPEDVTPEDVTPEDDAPEEVEGFSLEQLSAAYAQAARLHEAGSGDDAEAAESIETALREGSNPDPESVGSERLEQEVDEPPVSDLDDGPSEIATPEAIVEAALFVGHPDNKPLTAPRLASIMRDMTAEEVVTMIDQLNASYRHLRQGIRIAGDPVEGFRMVVAPEVEAVRSAFTGKVRETRLNQPAIEVLSLVAYQPGITASEVSDRRGRDSASLLNQMVRRRLLEVKRLATDESTRPVAHYYPAERLLVLLGLDSIDDLPQVEEANL